MAVSQTGIWRKSCLRPCIRLGFEGKVVYGRVSDWDLKEKSDWELKKKSSMVCVSVWELNLLLYVSVWGTGEEKSSVDVWRTGKENMNSSGAVVNDWHTVLMYWCITLFPHTPPPIELQVSFALLSNIGTRLVTTGSSFMGSPRLSSQLFLVCSWLQALDGLIDIWFLTPSQPL